jgi:hypothetical protein
MLSILDMINHGLGYFNLNVKLKNRIYTAIGFVGQWYLIYVAVGCCITVFGCAECSTYWSLYSFCIFQY